MKKQTNIFPGGLRFVAALVILYLYYAPACAQIKLWDKRFGGSDFDQSSTSLATPDGGYLLGGYSSSNIGGDKTQPSRGSTDFWVVKINEKGKKVWDREFGGTEEEALSIIVPTGDGKYLLGGWSASGRSRDKSQSSQGWSDYWVVKMDESGHKEWDLRFGGDMIDKLLSMTPTADGGFLLGGSSYSGISGDKTEASRGLDDFWVVKIDSDGNKLWDRRYGGAESDLLTEVIAVHDGGFLLAGRSSSKEGGDKTDGLKGEYDYWVVRIDEDGNKLWDKTFGGDLYDFPAKLLPTPDDGFLIGGSSDSNISGDVTQPCRGMDDFWVVKIDWEGNKLWDRRFGGDLADGLTAIEPTPDGNFLLGGWSYSNISGEKTEAPRDWGDFWMVKMDPGGNYLWDKTYGGDLYDGIFNISPMPDGNFLLVGTSQSDISGDKTQHSRGGIDFWIIKFNPNPPISVFPINIFVACEPLCPILDLTLASRFFHAASFSIRITLPAGKAVFNKSGHIFNPDLQSAVSFKIENTNTMLVTWKNTKSISLANKAFLVSTSIQILDPSANFQACVYDVEAFDETGKKIDIDALCGSIDLKNVKESISKEASASELTIFPNPGTDIFNLALPQAGDYTIDVRNDRGKALRKVNVSTKENDRVELDLQGLAPGLYHVTVTGGGRGFVGKIIKK